MKIQIPRRARRVVFGGTALLALTGMVACNFGPDNDKDILTLAGSDTTENVMAGLVDNYNADTTYNNNPDDGGIDDADDLYNVVSVQSTPKTVPGDEHCATRTWHTPAGAGEFPSPNGSSNGREALKASVLAGDGCVDIARSSGPPRAIGTGSGQDLDSFEYYAFALDALGWSSASTLAPANLTRAQLQGIYNCTFTNWNQVGGGNGQIQRYWPQSGSGTFQFAVSDLVGFDPRTFSSATCPAVIETQENSGQLIAANGHQQSALVPYSGANWVAHARGTAVPDQRSGQTIRNLNGQNIVRTDDGQPELAVRDSEFPTAPVAEANVALNDPTPDYPAIRYVFNVIDSTSASYASAIRYVGFENVENGSTSPLCSGGKAEIVASYGFGPLDGTTGATNLAGATCRRFS
jgi:phosphate transport system substrate-binding protein